MEKLTLTTAVSEFEITVVSMSWPLAQVIIVYKNELGHAHSLVITGAAATTMMNDINTGDHTVTSVHKMCLQKLNDDGILVGTISGTPD